MCTTTRVWPDCSRGTRGFLLLWSNSEPPALLPRVLQLRDVPTTVTWPLLLPSPGEREQNQNHSQKHQAKIGTRCSRPAPGRGGWCRVTEQPQLPEQGQEGSPQCSPGHDHGTVQREPPQGFTSFRENRLPGELSQNLPQGTGRQGERWVTVSCWQTFLLIKKKNQKTKQSPKEAQRKETLLATKPEVWVRYRNCVCYCVTATGLWADPPAAKTWLCWEDWTQSFHCCF